jgi:hypothetical protein
LFVQIYYGDVRDFYRRGGFQMSCTFMKEEAENRRREITGPQRLTLKINPTTFGHTGITTYNEVAVSELFI